MKFSTFAFFSTLAATVFGAPTVVKREDDPATGSLPLGGATSILAVLGPAQANIQGLLAQLSPVGGAPVDVATVNNVVQQVTTQLNGLTANLELLNGLGVEQLLGGDDETTVAQKVAGLANEVTGALSNVETVIGTALPELQGPLTELNNTLQGVLNTVVGLVNTLNALLTPLLAPVTGLLAQFGLLQIGLLGL